ncbi:MAG TPA: hypothetical protein VGM39_19365 [Kofleriaceae bacterium]
MRSKLAIIALVIAPSIAFAQEKKEPADPPASSDDECKESKAVCDLLRGFDQHTPHDAPTPEPPPEPTPPPPEPTPPPEPQPEPEPAPPSETPAAPPTEQSTEDKPTSDENAVPVRDYNIIVGLELGVGGPTGTSGTVYGSGRGAGLLVGGRYKNISLEWHFLQRYSLHPKDMNLDGDNTRGSMTASSADVRVRLLTLPVVVEALAGGAMLSAPIFVVTTNDLGNPLIKGGEMRGVGVMVGGAVGYQPTRDFALTFEVRGVLSPTWELPPNEYVVPGAKTSDGTAYTTSKEDPTGTMWTATVLARIFL